MAKVKRFVVGLVWNWSLYEGFSGVSTDYWIVYAENEAKATAIATASCEEERFHGDPWHWQYHEVFFCEDVNRAKYTALVQASGATRDWYPLEELCDALTFGTCYAPDGNWFYSQYECRKKYGIELD